MGYAVTFVLGQFKKGADRVRLGRCIQHMLGALFEIDKDYLRAFPQIPRLYESGIVYKQEPIGREDWQDIEETIKRGNGDCEDLSCWRAAELVVRDGIDAVPTWKSRVLRDGRTLYHIVVKIRLPDGRTVIEDPNKRLGMAHVIPWKELR